MVCRVQAQVPLGTGPGASVGAQTLRMGAELQGWAPRTQLLGWAIQCCPPDLYCFMLCAQWPTLLLEEVGGNLDVILEI